MNLMLEKDGVEMTMVGEEANSGIVGGMAGDGVVGRSEVQVQVQEMEGNGGDGGDSFYSYGMCDTHKTNYQ